MNSKNLLGFSRFLPLFYFLIFSVFILAFSSFVSAATDDISSYKQNNDIDIKVSCSNIDCSTPQGARITIESPDTSIIVNNKSMTIQESFSNYTLNNTLDLGKYTYYVVSTGGTPEFYEGNFKITPSGQGGNENIVFFIFAILLIYGITFTGFFGKNIPITILGGMAMIFLGVYLVNNGIIIFRDDLTNYIAYLTIGVGFITSSWALLEQFEVI